MIVQTTFAAASFGGGGGMLTGDAMVGSLFDKSLPYFAALLGAFGLTFVLTPLVREINRRFGMIDKPDPRRINRVPVPRGGGVALALGVIASYAAFVFLSGRPPLQNIALAPSVHWKLVALALGIVALGYADDKWNLPPKTKLLGQVVVAFLAWWWAGLGFASLWPSIPAWLDCFMTMFWFVGAINAFNLIDGLDGLASGIALIATLGMAGSLFLVRNPQAALFHFAFAGGLVGFLCYNYNPASVFLGDSGSMFIGFTLAALPLVTQTPDSFLVSVGVPVLAMGVPIFDSALAILRRSIRRLIRRQGTDPSGNDRVMTADTDHLHHRILRSVGLNQRRAAWILYLATAAAVLFGLVVASFDSKKDGLWLFGVAVATVVIFRNMARIELYDAGRLLDAVAHDRTKTVRRKWARLAVPLSIAYDLAALVGVFFLCLEAHGVTASRNVVQVALLIRVSTIFVMLVLFGVYRTVWSRAMLGNYIRLFVACALGSFASGAAVLLALDCPTTPVLWHSAEYTVAAFVFLAFLRIVRALVRDAFYAIGASRMKSQKSVSRVLVYGAGLRYRSFRRELVRTTAANERVIVGLLDDDVLLRGQQIGGIRIEGTLLDAPAVIERMNVDSVVVACVVTPEWMKVVRETLEPTGVKISLFSFSETPL